MIKLHFKIIFTINRKSNSNVKKKIFLISENSNIFRVNKLKSFDSFEWIEFTRNFQFPYYVWKYLKLREKSFFCLSFVWLPTITEEREVLETKMGNVYSD